MSEIKTKDVTKELKEGMQRFKDHAVSKSASVTGSAALPLDETWENFLEWIADYCGDKETAKTASYTREDMRHAFAAGYAKRRGEQ